MRLAAPKVPAKADTLAGSWTVLGEGEEEEGAEEAEDVEVLLLLSSTQVYEP